MAREAGVIPDLYFPDEDQELQTSSVEGEGGRGQGGGLLGRKTVDLTPEGFIPIHKLTLKDLPEPIRTEEHLQYILDISKNVVKVNNNGLSDKRPDDDEFKRRKQKSLSGSGFLESYGGNNVQIITNSHVLFNEEELKTSTFDVFFEYHPGDPDDKKKLLKRCARKDGKCFMGKYCRDDLALACFEVKDAMTARISQHCSEKSVINRRRQNTVNPDFTTELNVAPVVCLISHPLGQPKHVSFGEMVDYNMRTRIIHHDAPSKPGSSGGPVVIFSTSCFFPKFGACHVGTDPRNGKKYATLHPHEFSPLDMMEDDGVPSSDLDDQPSSAEEYALKAAVSLEMVSLAAFVPLVGPFLLHAEETRLAGLDTTALKPCSPSLTDAASTAPDLKLSVKETIEKLVQLAPSVALSPSDDTGCASDLVSLLESQEPCYCHSIVKMMESGAKLGDGTVIQCFLSPYTAATKMTSEFDVTWPWLNRCKSVNWDSDAVEGCLMKKCLMFCERNIIPVILLLMFAKANCCIKKLVFQPSDVSQNMSTDDAKSEWETLYRRTAEICSREQTIEKLPDTQHFPPGTSEENVTSSSPSAEGDLSGLSGDILSLLRVALGFASPLCTMKLINEPHNQRETSPQAVDYDPSFLYSRCLAMSEHGWKHEQQSHPDAERTRRAGGENWCQCGRHGAKEVILAYTALPALEHADRERDGQGKPTKTSNDKDFLPEPTADMGEQYMVHFLFFLRRLQEIAAEKSVDPGTLVPVVLHQFDAFPYGCHSLMLYMASRETLLYNFCLLARHISKRFLPRYLAFPVSVFGRPGNWPGNVTPSEVQRTAWRLIQDAIMASGFRPSVLAALEKDAERREKLINLYVDMKQLKWQGRIQPHLFGAYLASSSRCFVDYSQGLDVFRDSTHYFVWYAAFLMRPNIVFSRSDTSQLQSAQ